MSSIQNAGRESKRRSRKGLQIIGWCAWIVVLLLAGAREVNAQQPEIRVVSDKAAVRLSPDADARVIAILDIGALVELIGNLDVASQFYLVSVPHGSAKAQLAGYIAADEARIVAAESCKLCIDTDRQSIPNLKRRYEREEDRQSSGTRKMLWGFSMAALVRIALEYVPGPQTQDSTWHEVRRAVEYGTASLGGALGLWGMVEWVRGTRNVYTMETDYLEQISNLSIEEKYKKAQKRRSSGRNRFLWSTFATGAVQAAVTWIPYLGEPVEDDDLGHTSDYEEVQERRNRVETVRNWTAMLGSGLAMLGASQWILANHEMGKLENREAQQNAMATVELFIRHESSRTAVGVQWTW